MVHTLARTRVLPNRKKDRKQERLFSRVYQIRCPETKQRLSFTGVKQSYHDIDMVFKRRVGLYEDNECATSIIYSCIVTFNKSGKVRITFVAVCCSAS